jgi:hypothetical protein
MTCTEFQNRFSDYYDGTGEPAFMAKASSHLDGCPECRRYRDVVEQGIQILKAVPAPSVSDDFLPRLQHRIYHLEDGQALSRGETAGSATSTTTALLIAMLIAAAAWSPALMRAPEVQLEPVVVTRPEPRVVGIRTPGYRDLLALETEPTEASLIHQGLWDDPMLLTRYSPLSGGRARAHSVLRHADLE